ncbi:MAG: SRPBCC domain-containing protein [Weeksellaceae bacterium]
MNIVDHTINGSELTLTRTFDAPRELVWKAFTEPELIAKWWGPRGWNTKITTMEVKPGGVWHYCMVGPNGEEAWGLSTYKELNPPAKMIYTDAFCNAEGVINESMPQIDVVMDFIDVDGKTKIVSKSTYATEAELKTVVDMGMLPGITETWDRLAEHLQSV